MCHFNFDLHMYLTIIKPLNRHYKLHPYTYFPWLVTCCPHRPLHPFTLFRSPCTHVAPRHSSVEPNTSSCGMNNRLEAANARAGRTPRSRFSQEETVQRRPCAGFIVSKKMDLLARSIHVLWFTPAVLPRGFRSESHRCHHMLRNRWRVAAT